MFMNAKKRILVIDDEPDYAFVLRLALEGTGRYVVREENDPARAEDAARAFRPDLVVLDLLMPGLHGPEVADQLASDPELKGLPVVYLTALPVDADGGLPPGWGDVGGPVLCKFTPPDELADVFDREMEQHADRSAGSSSECDGRGQGRVQANRCPVLV